MKRVLILALFLMFAFMCEVKPQSITTKILRFEIDGKPVKKKHRVYLRSSDTWIQAQTNETGFVVPAALTGNKELAVRIEFGKTNLIFNNIRISKFDQEWVVGIDRRPLSKENVSPRFIDQTKCAYYIEFLGGGIETRLVVLDLVKPERD